ncbi:HPP-domain-containing protein [Xylaria telfairii]|nr:HPP-domain-containing protein [Xylaria telfairii]
MNVPSSLKPCVPWITRWLGIRDASSAKNPPKAYVPYIWAFIGAFSGLAVLQAIFGQAGYFIQRGVPPLIASYGASAVLCFGVLESPLAQPRSVVGGHFISALTGIIYTRIFRLYNLSDSEAAPRLAWLAASLSTATAIAAMQLTKTTHPPAGATALLPILQPAINNLGWYLLPVVLLSSTVMVAVALLTNNLQRRYPVFWWAPPKPVVVLPVSQAVGKEDSDTPPEDVLVQKAHD